jgi:hypothetical protein
VTRKQAMPVNKPDGNFFSGLEKMWRNDLTVSTDFLTNRELFRNPN